MSNTVNQDGSITVSVEDGYVTLNLENTRFHLYHSDMFTPVDIQGWYISCNGMGYYSPDKKIQDILTSQEFTSLQSLLSKLFTTIVSE